ncbi:MAG: mutarotase [Lewinellaceae bacterium]|nr:mutarotase [Lewinellaceae bacterium]
MNIQEIYDQMWENALEKFSRSEFEYDPWLDSKEDKRYGITLLARPGGEAKEKIQNIIEAFRQVAPHQYYYPAPDLHLTILSIISCREGFSLSDKKINEYIQKVEDALEGKRPFSVRYKGLAASPGCILVRGFPENRELELIREDLRRVFKASSLPHSIDSRYRLETAHSTIARFRRSISSPTLFIGKLQELRAVPIGTISVSELELVFNDWYQRSGKTRVLGRFLLG